MLVTVGLVCCRLHRAIRWLILKGSWKDDICHAGKKSTARDASDVNRLNGPLKILTATDGQQINLTANYFSQFSQSIIFDRRIFIANIFCSLATNKSCSRSMGHYPCIYLFLSNYAMIWDSKLNCKAAGASPQTPPLLGGGVSLPSL